MGIRRATRGALDPVSSSDAFHAGTMRLRGPSTVKVGLHPPAIGSVTAFHPNLVRSHYTVPNGKVRYRLPVNRDRALTTAGEITGTGGSPHPDGFSVLGTIWTSTAAGASMM